MPKKATTKTAETEQVTPIVSTTIDVAPVTEKKVRKTKSVKSEDVTVAPVETPALVDATAVDTEVDAPVAEKSVEFLAKLQQLGVVISNLKTEYRALEKQWSRELKSAQKQSSKRKRKAGNRAPSGIVKPQRISDKLA